VEQRKLIDMHKIIREGSPSVTDILDLKAASQILMPTKESQMLRTMRAFGVVLAVALGTSLELYKSNKEDVIDSYDVIQPKLEALAELYPEELIYAQVLRWLQLRLQEYWTEVEVASGRASPPNFKMLLDRNLSDPPRPPLALTNWAFGAKSPNLGEGDSPVNLSKSQYYVKLFVRPKGRMGGKTIRNSRHTN
jgi:hypothetical protein